MLVMKTILTILIFLYASTGIIFTLGYIPTVRDLTKRRGVQIFFHIGFGLFAEELLFYIKFY